MDTMLNVVPTNRRLNGRRSLAVDKNKREVQTRATNSSGSQASSGGTNHSLQQPQPDGVGLSLLSCFSNFSTFYSVSLVS